MSNPLFDLTGRTALITGSTRGLGRAFAEGLAAAGARAILNGTDPVRVATAVDPVQTRDHVRGELGVLAVVVDVDQLGEVVVVEDAVRQLDLAARGRLRRTSGTNGRSASLS